MKEPRVILIKEPKGILIKKRRGILIKEQKGILIQKRKGPKKFFWGVRKKPQIIGTTKIDLINISIFV